MTSKVEVGVGGVVKIVELINLYLWWCGLGVVRKTAPFAKGDGPLKKLVPHGLWWYYVIVKKL